MPADVYEGPAMNHSYHEMIIGHGGCFSTIVFAESTCHADYHQAQFLATQMALAERGRAVVSITLRDLEEASLRALDEFFRAGRDAHPASKITMARFRPPRCQEPEESRRRKNRARPDSLSPSS